MTRVLKLRSRYYRTIPVDNTGYEEEILELEADRTTFVALHCWNIGAPDGPPIDVNYCVGMGYPETFREALRIVEGYILPAVEAARAADVLVSHVESGTIAAKHPQAQMYLDPPGSPPGPTQPPAVPGYREKTLARNHGSDYPAKSPLPRMDRISALMPSEGEPFVHQTGQFDRILRMRGIENIIYSGFATDMCILNAPGGIAPMAELGYRVYLLREATLGVECPDTLEERIATRWAIRFFETHYGDTIGFEDLLDACTGLARRC